MGMYDTVIIENLKLPLPKDIKNYLDECYAKVPSDFQTKNLENCLLTYKIDRKGQIYQEIRKPTGKRIPYKNPFEFFFNNRSFLERLYFRIKDGNALSTPKTVEEYKTILQKSNLTNVFEIYTFEEVGGRQIDFSYKITAVGGKVKSVKLLKSSLENQKDSIRRKAASLEIDKRFDAKIKAANIFKSKWYYPILREVYNPFVFFTKLILQKTCNYIISKSYKWNGV
jgi:hypothetical protein